MCDGGCAGQPAGLLRCFGLGIVRAFDPARRELHLVTPFAPEALAAAGADVLVPWRGANDLPVQLLYRAAPSGDAFVADIADIVRVDGSGGGGVQVKRRRSE